MIAPSRWSGIEATPVFWQMGKMAKWKMRNCTGRLTWCDCDSDWPYLLILFYCIHWPVLCGRPLVAALFPLPLVHAPRSRSECLISQLTPSLPPSLPRPRPPLHQQVQFQSHFHPARRSPPLPLSLSPTIVIPESRALERRKKSTEAISILDLGLHCKEDTRVSQQWEGGA